MRSTIHGEDFYISYINQSTEPAIGLLESITGTSLQPPEEGETALCRDGQYWILDGDHLEQYRPLVKQSFEACMKYYTDNIHLKSKYDTNGMEN